MAFKKRHIPLGVRLSLLIFFMTLGTGIVITLTSYGLYMRKQKSNYIALAESIIAVGAGFIDGETADFYHKTGIADENYERLHYLLTNLGGNFNIDSLYITKFTEENCYLIFDAEDEGEEYLSLNFADPWNPGFPDEEKTPFLEGREIPPEIFDSNLAGKVLTVHRPLRYRNGDIAKGFYIAVDYSMRAITRERIEYFGIVGIISLGIALIFAFIQWSIVRRSVVWPINVMADAVKDFLVLDDEQKNDQGSKMSSLSKLSIETGDEIETFANTLKKMEKTIWAYITNTNKMNIQESIDSLTGLYDQKTFYDYMNMFIHRGRKPGQFHAFFALNLDRFRQLNETYGHAMGDQTLKNCADSLKQIFRSSDDIARTGGDSFTILCRNIGNEKAVKEKAIQLQEALAKIKPFYLADGITGSIGIITFAGEPVDYKELQQKVFLLVGEIKLRGRNVYRIESYTP
jgi:diguanylate cyclase (GGDEF)-like protein